MHITTRLKNSRQIIGMIRPNELVTHNLIYPIFIREDGKVQEIPSLTGQRYYSLNDCNKPCEDALNLGIPAVMIFGILDKKDVEGSVALKKNSFHSQIFKKLKKEFSDE